MKATLYEALGILPTASDDKLNDDALRFEEEISRVVAADDELAEYVKELKRREFAQ